MARLCRPLVKGARCTLLPGGVRKGDRLAQRGLVADVYAFGGAAMALAYDAR